MAWKVDSYLAWQRLHSALSIIFLFLRFSLVGSASEHTLQRKVLILLGTRSFHMQFQKVFWFEVSELAASILLSSSHSNLYPVLTKYSPLRQCGQIILSARLESLNQQRGITFILCALNHRKCWSIKPWFYVLVSGLIKQSTVAPFKAGIRGDNTLADSLPGNQLSS